MVSQWFSVDSKENRSWLIGLNSLNIRSEIRQRALTEIQKAFDTMGHEKETIWII